MATIGMGRGRLLRGAGCWRGGSDDEIDLQAREFHRESRETLDISLCPTVLDQDVPAFDIAVVAEPLPERVQHRLRLGRSPPTDVQETDAWDLFQRLRLDDERRREKDEGCCHPKPGRRQLHDNPGRAGNPTNRNEPLVVMVTLRTARLPTGC
jgi:hypothetical protein